MRRHERFFRAAVAAYLVVAMQGGMALGASEEPFTMTIAAANAEVKAGSSVELKVHLSNTSGREIDASYSSERGMNLGYNYDIRDKDGNSAIEITHNGPLSLSAHMRSLKPNESLDDVTVLSREYDLSLPGEYTIQLSRPISSNPSDGVVESNKITVTVVP